MRDALRLALTLALVCAVAAGALAAVNGMVSGRIEENNRLEAVRKRREVFPAAQEFSETLVAGRTVFVARDAGGAALGVVITAAPRGYAGPIGMTVGVGPDGRVAGLAISKLDQTETPGLGVKVTLAPFRDQFRGRAPEEVRLRKEGGRIDAITAATISSRAVVNGVREALAWYREHFPAGPAEVPRG